LRTLAGQAIAFCGLSGPAKARDIDRVEKPQFRESRQITGGKTKTAGVTEFRGPAAHPNRRQQAIVCPTFPHSDLRE
jgi:hypothetical protein